MVPGGRARQRPSVADKARLIGGATVRSAGLDYRVVSYRGAKAELSRTSALPRLATLRLWSLAGERGRELPGSRETTYLGPLGYLRWSQCCMGTCAH
jgi:hypothetical protein